MTLAMVDFRLNFDHHSTYLVPQPASLDPAEATVALPKEGGPSVEARPANEKVPSLSLRLPQENEPEPTFGSTMHLTRTESNDSRLSRIFSNKHLQAGFGEIFHDKQSVIYGRNGTGFEEPSCGFFKISFAF